MDCENAKAIDIRKTTVRLTSGLQVNINTHFEKTSISIKTIPTDTPIKIN